MGLYLLASGTLISDPQSREGAKRSFTTAAIRTSGDETILVSVIAFGDEGKRLLDFVKGAAIAVSGRARLTSWVGRDGVEKRGLGVVAEQIIAAKPRSKLTVKSQRHAAVIRRSRSPSLPGRASGPGALLSDSVDDLWQDGPIP